MTIQILSLIIAMLAVIVGPIVTYRITKRNLEFQFRTLIQEKWIDKLETTALEFLNSNVQWVEKYKGLMMRGAQGTITLGEVNQSIDSMLDSINSSIIKLQILLDDTKSIQKEIIEKSILMKSIVLKNDINEQNLNQLFESHETIIMNLKKIFQEERHKLTKTFR